MYLRQFSPDFGDTLLMYFRHMSSVRAACAVKIASNRTRYRNNKFSVGVSVRVTVRVTVLRIYSVVFAGNAVDVMLTHDHDDNYSSLVLDLFLLLTASEMTDIVSGEVLNTTHSLYIASNFRIPLIRLPVMSVL